MQLYSLGHLLSSSCVIFCDDAASSQITVHGGFLSAYDSIKPQIFMLLDAITEAGTSEEPWRVHVTGHSLGGALATLCAYELATRQ
jgi:nuclear pore complex protein Nup85